VLELVAYLFSAFLDALDEVRFRNPTVLGYKRAWKIRQRTGETDKGLLLSEISKAGFEEGVRPPYAAAVEVALRSWEEGATPEEVRSSMRSA
jgi:hypothetical protein